MRKSLIFLTVLFVAFLAFSTFSSAIAEDDCGAQGKDDKGWFYSEYKHSSVHWKPLKKYPCLASDLFEHILKKGCIISNPGNKHCNSITIKRPGYDMEYDFIVVTDRETEEQKKYIGIAWFLWKSYDSGKKPPRIVRIKVKKKITFILSSQTKNGSRHSFLFLKIKLSTATYNYTRTKSESQ